ncbi:MAG: ABC transporter permease subunit [Verrucomicrobiales bacterium]
MTRVFLRCLALALARWCSMGLFLFLLVEFSFCVVGGSNRHVWLPESYGSVPAPLSVQPTGLRELVGERSSASFLALGLAYGGVVLVGYGWGILAARFRRFRAASILALPFSAFACVPGFWFVVLVAIYSYVVWKRPGFADELVVDSGPNFLAWWHAAVVALPAMAPAAAWQIRSVASVIEAEASRPFVRGLYLAGYGDDDIFYGNVFRRAVPGIVSLFDRTLPSVLGSLIVAEWAFRYEGMGSLIVDSVRLGFYPGIFLGGLWMAAIVGLATMARQVAEQFLRPG